jgi:hypothetical protein
MDKGVRISSFEILVRFTNDILKFDVGDIARHKYGCFLLTPILTFKSLHVICMTCTAGGSPFMTLYELLPKEGKGRSSGCGGSPPHPPYFYMCWWSLLSVEFALFRWLRFIVGSRSCSVAFAPMLSNDYTRWGTILCVY